MNKDTYMHEFEMSRRLATDVAAGRTGHTRRDVAYNQIDHDMALRKAKVTGCDVPYFKCSDFVST